MVLFVSMIVGGAISAQAAAHSSLPECAASFSGEVVLNSDIVDRMLVEAEPGGARPNRDDAMLFIVVKHYDCGAKTGAGCRL
jgi:hypothetical protein